MTSHRIGEIGKMLDISPITIRLWEKSGLIPKASRSATGQRKYTDSDIEEIRHYLKNKK